MLEEKCQATSEALSRDGFDIPWELIQDLVEWVMENCFSRRRAFSDAAQDPSRWQMYQLYRQARKRLRRQRFRGRELRKASNALVDAVLRDASICSSSELDDIYGEG